MSKLLQKILHIPNVIYNLVNYYQWQIYSLRGNDFETKQKYQSRYITFPIKKGDKVLDVGSGGEPFVKATHLTDMFPNKTQHRYNALLTNNKPFTQSSIESLPFSDKAFDFVYCAHVLEHVEKPWIACDELMRVARQGYIEVPTRTSDIIFNFVKLPNFHKWHVTMTQNTLIFVEYSKAEQKDTQCQEIFKLAHAKINNPIKRMLKDHKNLITNMFLWKKTFNYYIFNQAGSLIATNTKRQLNKKRSI